MVPDDLLHAEAPRIRVRVACRVGDEQPLHDPVSERQLLVTSRVDEEVDRAAFAVQAERGSSSDGPAVVDLRRPIAELLAQSEAERTCPGRGTAGARGAGGVILVRVDRARGDRGEAVVDGGLDVDIEQLRLRRRRISRARMVAVHRGGRRPAAA